MKQGVPLTLIVVIIAIGLSIYFNYYSESPTTNVILDDEFNSEISLTISDNEKETEILDNFSNVKYFHFGKVPITYFVTDDECGNETETIKNAFNIIHNSTDGVVSFLKINDSLRSDIKIDCKPVGTYVSGTQTLGEALFYNDSFLLTNGEITFYTKGPKEFRMVDYCQTGFPRTEVHEIFHVFGFDHDNSPVNIMNMVNDAGKCGINKINSEFIWCLKYIYSNGDTGTCENIMFTDPNPINIDIEECENDWYPDISDKWCCPEPNMTVDSHGYCE